MAQERLNFLFIVQGEGRGHMTQAIALRKMLHAAGHRVSAVMVGKNDRRELPGFFKEQIGSKVRRYRSPTFKVDKKRRGVRIGPTIWSNFLRLPLYIKSLYLIRRYIRRTKPDVIVNFYEILAGFSFLCFGTRGAKVVSVGHQYLLYHPDFEWPEGKPVDRGMLLFSNWITAQGTEDHLALSFRPMPDIPDQNITVCPPLLRREVLEADPEKGDFILVYLLNDGYAEDIAEWHAKHPEVVIHAFWDRHGAAEVTEMQPNLTFHRLSGEKFLNYMRKCRAFVSTAGFESICEAMYLGKPVMLVPTEGHFEQQCNAIDAVKAGAGMTSDHFDFDSFLPFLETFEGDYTAYRKWVASAEHYFLKHLTEIARHDEFTQEQWDADGANPMPNRT